MTGKKSATRLFLFAAYDRGGAVDDALVYYVRALSRYGDVVVCMDNDATGAQLKKLRPYAAHVMAARHGEYDFGSYKRAYIWARDNMNLPGYDFVYMVNDSVYGPLDDIGITLADLESRGLDAFGPVCNPHRDHPHIQSWFIGMRPRVFLSSWFDEFITSVTHLAHKGLITKQYEQGFTKHAAAHGASWGCAHCIPGRGIYNQVRHTYRIGVPFIKKVAFSRHGGTYGRQILYVLRHCDPAAAAAVISGARRIWGDEYIDWLLTGNPFKIICRGIKNAITKVRSGTL